jgi:hypothetical protein
MSSRISRTLVIAAASAVLLASMAQAGGSKDRAHAPRTDRAVPARPINVTKANAERASRSVKTKCERRELDCSRETTPKPGGEG